MKLLCLFAVHLVFSIIFTTILFMIIEQTVDIPASRQIILDVPPQIPLGKVNIIVQFPIKDSQSAESVPIDARGQLNNEVFRQALHNAQGAWKKNPWKHPVEDVNDMRNEWER